MSTVERLEIEAAARPAVRIRLLNISKFYSGVPALQNVDVEFYEGEVHAVLGENGAGKSTLMNIISGALQPDQGEIEFGGKVVSPISPEIATSLGIAISFQHPAILDDLSVLENFQVALPPERFKEESAHSAVKAALDDVGLHVPLRMRADALTVAQNHLLEIAKALAIKPKVLILDEPTAALDQEATDMLFRHIRDLVQAGTSVIYITHRLAEVRQIAQRVTVLRDGQVRGVARVDAVSDDELLSLIVGRSLGSAFPPKASDLSGEIDFSVQSLTGRKFKDVSFDVPRGQIIGIAGVEGNGQSELMRALAGLEQTTGTVLLNGRQLNHTGLLREAAFMPSDRHTEGMARSLTVRENATFAALDKFSTLNVTSRKRELDQVTTTFRSLAVKAPGLEAPILSLSGGNQQKVVMARALLSGPGLIVADEPTQGVDVGARAEIYSILREVSNSGTPVIVNSSDAAELGGFCDQVIVMSRGRVVERLTGDDVTEAKIVAAAVGAVHHVGDVVLQDESKSIARGLRHFVQSDNAPVVPLMAIIAVLGLYIFSINSNFLSTYNIYNVLLLATALGFIALGQTVALLMGGIDLSVGPLAGFLVVVASFFINDDKSAAMITAGFLLIFGGAFIVGAINGLLIRFANFTAIAATLAMYIGLQGASFLLREGVGGYINFNVVDYINWQVGPIPVAFAVMVVLALAGEYWLRKTRQGWQLRAAGSDEDAARRIGVHTNRVFVLGYIATSMLTALGAVMLMAQIGVGDPRQGASYTLLSITAVVLGGTSLRGGRGTFIGTVLGAVLLTEVLNVVAFLGLSQTYQYIFQGTLVLVAALTYSIVRRRSGA